MENRRKEIKIFLLDEDPNWLGFLTDLLFCPSLPLALKTATHEEALDRIWEADLVIMRERGSKGDDASLLSKIRELRPSLPVMIVSPRFKKDHIRWNHEHRENGPTYLLGEETLESHLWPWVIKSLEVVNELFRKGNSCPEDFNGMT